MRPHRRVPYSVKLLYSAFVAIVVPLYWVTYSPWNFLYFCDVALLVTAMAIWIESPLLVSTQAVAIVATRKAKRSWKSFSTQRNERAAVHGLTTEKYEKDVEYWEKLLKQIGHK